MVNIYAMSDPARPYVIRYVGKTVKPLRKRLNQHVSERHKFKCHKNDWLNAVVSVGRRPMIWLLEKCEQSDWEERERAWIADLRLVQPLTNGSEGGNTGPDMTGYKHTPETCAKMREIRAKIIHKFKWSPERRARQVPMMKHKRFPKWANEKATAVIVATRSWQKGLQRSWLNNRGRKYSPERIEKVRRALKGRSLHPNSIAASKKRVQCVETGEVFESINAAAASCNRVRTAVGNAVNHKTTCAGYHWQRA